MLCAYRSWKYCLQIMQPLLCSCHSNIPCDCQLGLSSRKTPLTFPNNQTRRDLSSSTYVAQPDFGWQPNFKALQCMGSWLWCNYILKRQLPLEILHSASHFAVAHIKIPFYLKKTDFGHGGGLYKLSKSMQITSEMAWTFLNGVCSRK